MTVGLEARQVFQHYRPQTVTNGPALTNVRGQGAENMMEQTGGRGERVTYDMMAGNAGEMAMQSEVMTILYDR